VIDAASFFSRPDGARSVGRCLAGKAQRHVAILRFSWRI